MSSSDTYLTLSEPSEAVVREKMSRFLAFAAPVNSVDEAKEFIARYQREYHDARHVCWAYMIGIERITYQSSDNGEPSGTAGKPILGQINSFNLSDVAIVVVRYFGGIKLGTPGLIAAYRQAAREAIENGTIIEKTVMENIVVQFGYEVTNSVMKIVKALNLKVLSQKFDNICELRLSVRAAETESVRSRFADIDTVQLEVPQRDS